MVRKGLQQAAYRTGTTDTVYAYNILIYKTKHMNIFDTIDARRILPSTEITPHQFLFSWNDKPCFARGELVALTSKAKSGKTYVCSILMALAVKRQLMGLQRLQDEPLKVVWIDTEQSADSTQEILCIRIASLIGQAIPNDRYFVYNLRPDNWQDRLSLVLTCIGLHQPDLVIFDGIRDVVGDINNYQEAQTVLEKLLGIASYYNCCVVCVLHQNKSLEDKSLRGALGTELQNKSYETYECQKDPDTRLFCMRQIATRKYDITAKMEFSVDDNGLPVLEATPTHTKQGGESVQGYYARLIDAKRIIPIVFGNETSMRAYELKQKTMRLIPEVNCETAFRELLRQAYDHGLITKRKINNNETYYDLQTVSPKDSEIEVF